MRVSFKRGDPHEAEIDLGGGFKVEIARRITNAREVTVPIVTAPQSAFGALPDARILIAADNTARRLAGSALEMIRPITPVDTGALVGSLSLTQLGVGSWAVTYGPFYGYFQFWGTRSIEGLRNELNDILRAVAATVPAVLAEEVQAAAA
ncbi:MAG: hypothetical protein ACHQ1G_00030 [Planctomycetota bacterium]